MKTINAVLALTLSIGAGLFAQSQAIADTPPAGSVLVCPSILPPGKPATICVMYQSKPVANATLDVDGTTATTDNAGRCSITVPPEAKSVTIKMKRPSDTIAVRPNVGPGSDSVSPQIGQVFESVQPDHLVTISGAGFSGVADANTVEFKPEAPEAQPVAGTVLAATTNQLVVKVPELPTGRATLTVKTEAGQSQVAVVDVVSISFHIPKPKLSRGSREKMDVVVEGTEQNTVVRIRNLTPDTVKLLPSQDFFINTSGGKRNKATFAILVQKDGDYDVQALLESVGGKQYRELPLANKKAP